MGSAGDLQHGFSHHDGPSITIDLTKNWNVSFDTEMGGSESYNMEELTSLSDIDLEGIKYYSGTAISTHDFTIQEGMPLKETDVTVIFDDIQEIAKAYINGNDCGIIWAPPYRANITERIKPGKSKITVQVTNTWNNRIGGDLRNPDKKAHTKTNAKNKFNENSPLSKSGLMGKSELLFGHNNANKL